MIAPMIERPHQQQTSIVIQAQQAEVWQVIADFNNVYTWAPGVKASHALGTKRQQVGAGRYCELADFGQIEEYITRWDEGQGYVYDVTPVGPLINGLSSWWLKPTDQNTTELTVTLGYDIRFGLLGKALHGLIMRRKLKSSLEQTMASLKACVETGKTLRPLVAKVA